MKVHVGSNNYPIFPRVTAINRLNATRLHELKRNMQEEHAGVQRDKVQFKKIKHAYVRVKRNTPVSMVF